MVPSRAVITFSAASHICNVFYCTVHNVVCYPVDFALPLHHHLPPPFDLHPGQNHRAAKSFYGPHPLLRVERGIPLTTTYFTVWGMLCYNMLCVTWSILYRNPNIWLYPRASIAIACFLLRTKTRKPHTHTLPATRWSCLAFRQPIGSKYHLHLTTFTTNRGIRLAADCCHYGFQAGH
jgi:hypothetical protein